MESYQRTHEHIESLAVRVGGIEDKMIRGKDRLDILEQRIEVLESRQREMAQDITNILGLLDRVVGSIEIGIDTRKLSITEMIDRLDSVGKDIKVDVASIP